MNDQPAKVIGETIGTSVGEITVAIAVIVQTLKEQPGFNVEDFNSKIKSAIDNLSAREEDKRPLTLSILQTTL